jgi:hypothetical protein
MRNQQISEDCKRDIDWAARKKPAVLAEMGIILNPIQPVPWKTMDSERLKNLLLKLVVGSSTEVTGDNLGLEILDKIIKTQPVFDGYPAAMDNFIKKVQKIFADAGCVNQEESDQAISAAQFEAAKGRLMNLINPKDESINRASLFNLRVHNAVKDDHPGTFSQWLNSFSYRYYDQANLVDQALALRPAMNSSSHTPKEKYPKGDPGTTQERSSYKRPNPTQGQGSGNKGHKTATSATPGKSQPKEPRLCRVCNNMHPGMCDLWIHPMANHEPVPFDESTSGKFLKSKGYSKLPRTVTLNHTTGSMEPWDYKTEKERSDRIKEEARSIRRRSYGGSGGLTQVSDSTPATILMMASATLTDSTVDVKSNREAEETGTTRITPKEDARASVDRSELDTSPASRSKDPASVTTARALVADGSRTRGTRAQLLEKLETPQLLLDTGTVANFVSNAQRKQLKLEKIPLAKPVSVRTIHGQNKCLYYCIVHVI